MTTLTAKHFEEAEIQTVELDEPKGTVRIRPISGELRRKLAEMTASASGPTAEIKGTAFLDIATQFCAYSVLDENDQPLADVKFWGDRSLETLSELFEHITRVSGVGASSLESAKKNSQTTPNASPSGTTASHPAPTPTNSTPVSTAAN